MTKEKIHYSNDPKVQAACEEKFAPMPIWKRVAIVAVISALGAAAWHAGLLEGIV